MYNFIKMKFLLITLIMFLITAEITSAQTDNKKMKEIYSLALDGNIKSALNIFESIDASELNEKETNFRKEFILRFGTDFDESGFLSGKDSEINELMLIYRNYWRNSFLSSDGNYENKLKIELSDFFKIGNSNGNKISSDSLDTEIDIALKNYIGSKGLKTTGFGITGKFYDLLVWKSESDTDYTFNLKNEVIKCKVVFMTDFVTLGWEEYATIGKYYPGGWATKEALFCVKDAYDLESENFLISYLAHEGRHFEDYKIFPELSGADLEYRAKLTELSLLNETLFRVLEHFILSSNYDSDNAHSIANYCVVRDMSREFFGNDFEKDIERWKSHSVNEINTTAYSLLKKNTSEINALGSETKKFIKK